VKNGTNESNKERLPVEICAAARYMQIQGALFPKKIMNIGFLIIKRLLKRCFLKRVKDIKNITAKVVCQNSTRIRSEICCDIYFIIENEKPKVLPTNNIKIQADKV
tara:strand:- start:211 stop:528 length:318 start_codon:yes stop_codon:yes gene_type:complete